MMLRRGNVFWKEMDTIPCNLLDMTDSYKLLFPLQAVVKMVQEACSYVEKTPDLETKLALIDTLRAVTAGKV